MSLFITSLNSGSNGNCYYIGNENEAVLIDAGLTCRETEKRMSRLGLQMSKVKAIFISHEHGDHIKGVSVIARKHQLPVYVTPATLRHSRLDLPEHLIASFQKFATVTIGALNVLAFPKFHDAAEPHSFIVEERGIKIGIFTDIGVVCEQLSYYFGQCHAAFLEANYEEDMLENGRYPFHLKHRIRSGHGHLSNKQALELFVARKPKFMSHVLLAQLSKDNNCPDLALNMFKHKAGSTEVMVASRYGETPVLEIQREQKPAQAAVKHFAPVQLSMF